MKSLYTYITEAYDPQTYGKVIYFPSPSSACIGVWELFGQVSDGEYENARPSDHWKWITKITDVRVSNGGTVGYVGTPHVKSNYKFTKWPVYVQKGLDGDDVYDWAIRNLAYGAWGNAYGAKVEELLSREDTNDIRKLVEDLYEYLKDDDNDDTVGAFKAHLKDKNNTDSLKLCNILSDSLIKKYRVEIGKYTLNDFKKDLNFATKAINTNVQE